MKILTRIFLLLSGMAFLLLASASFLANLSIPVDMSPINIPIFQLPLPWIYAVAGGLAAPVGIVCLLARRPKLPLVFVALVALGFLGGRMLVSLVDASGSLAGYLGTLGGVFGLRGGTAEMILIVVSSCLLAGSVAIWKSEHSQPSRAQKDVS